eukprot:16436154-Heterocapsa_arctica.AAC.1
MEHYRAPICGAPVNPEPTMSLADLTTCHPEGVMHRCIAGWPAEAGEHKVFRLPRPCEAGSTPLYP